MDNRSKVKAYVDLLRLHFLPAWPLLFCSGLALGFMRYGGFSWEIVLKAVLISALGFEAGIVLNDYVDRDLDRRDVDDKLTRYWRPFRKRPIPSGMISAREAMWIYRILALSAALVIVTLPYPNYIYVLGLMAFSYMTEYFYQIRKRDQRLPVAQLVGRLDLAFFPVAGYLCVGRPDHTALAYLLFLYPWTQAHLAVNDLADVLNDRMRRLKTVTTLYGTRGTAAWIILFTVLHYAAGIVFMRSLGPVARAGVVAGFLLVLAANCIILKKKSRESAIKALPLFHASLMAYSASIIADYFVYPDG